MTLPIPRDASPPAVATHAPDPAPVTATVIPAEQWRLAACIPLPPTGTLRDPGTAIEEFADFLIHDLAPFMRATYRRTLERQPVWCPAGCHTDLRQLTEAQQEDHWDRHGWRLKRQARKRAGWR